MIISLLQANVEELGMPYVLTLTNKFYKHEKIVKLEKLVVLTTSQKKEILGGVPKDWFSCCLKEDSFGDPPLGCESWVLCEGYY